MAAINNHQTRKKAVVTGGNKGIGYEICKQLMKEGVMVVLTARDEKKGKEAVERLLMTEHSSSSSPPPVVVFHQVDVSDPQCVSSLVHFIRSNYGNLDILVNNAGVNGLMVEGDVSVLPEMIEREAKRGFSTTQEDEGPIKSNGKLIETYEWAEECINTNYYGAKRMIDAFIPLLLLSPSPRIVNISSLLGKIKLVSNEWAIKALSDEEGLTTEKVDEVVNEFLMGFKEGLLKEKGWPTDIAAYKVSKAALNAYTRIVAQNYSSICVNCICPGFAKTDITCNTGPLTPEEAAQGPLYLALLPEDGPPSGKFFYRKNLPIPF